MESLRSTVHADAAASRMVSRATTAAVALAAVAILSFRLGSGPIHTDEATYLINTHELVAADRWFPPTYFGELHVNKPPLGYWFLRAAFATNDESLATARIPSVLFGAALVALLHATSARWCGALAAAFGATAFLLSPLALSNHALRGATFDAPLALLVTGGCLAAVASRIENRPRLFRITIGLAALSVLLKGLAGPVFMAAVVFATEIVAAEDDSGTAARLASAARRAGVLLGVGVSVWLAWLGVLSASGAQALFDRLVVEDLFRRVFTGLHDAHQRPMWFYLFLMKRDFGWTLLALIPLFAAALRRASVVPGERVRTRLARAVLAWPIVLLTLLSLSRSKTSWYALPAWTGLGVCLALGLGVVLENRRLGVRRVAAVLALVLLATRAVEAQRHLRWLSRHVQPGWQTMEAVAAELDRLPDCGFHLVGEMSSLRLAPPWVAFGVQRIENLRRGWPAQPVDRNCALVLAPLGSPIPGYAEDWPRQTEGLGPFVLFGQCGGCLTASER